MDLRVLGAPATLEGLERGDVGAGFRDGPWSSRRFARSEVSHRSSLRSLSCSLSSRALKKCFESAVR